MEQEQIDDVRKLLEGKTIKSVEYTGGFYEPFTLTLDDGTLVYSSGTGTQEPKTYPKYTAEVRRASDHGEANKPPCEGADHRLHRGEWYWAIELDDIGDIIDDLGGEIIITRHHDHHPEDFRIVIHDDYLY